MPEAPPSTGPNLERPPAEPTAMWSAVSRSADVALHVWAAPLLAGRVVLELEVGRGRGAAVLLERGVARVIGLGTEGPMLEALAAEASPRLEILVGSPTEIPLADGEIDAALWAGVPPDLTSFVPALDELKRILRPDGLLVVGVELPEEPHSNHELGRAALDAIGNRFGFVAVADARSHAAAVVRNRGGGASSPPAISTLDPPGPPDRLLVVAGAERFDPPPDTAVLAATADLASFEREVVAARDREIARLRDEAAVLSQLSEERGQILDALEDSERALAEVPDLHETISFLRTEIAELEHRVERGDRTMRDLQSSGSWKVTRPLRAAKAMARS